MEFFIAYNSFIANNPIAIPIMVGLVIGFYLYVSNK